MAIFFKQTKTTWDQLLKPALNTASPYIGMAVSAKKNPKTAQATSNFLKSISGSNVSSLTNMHTADRFRLKVM